MNRGLRALGRRCGWSSCRPASAAVRAATQGLPSAAPVDRQKFGRRQPHRQPALGGGRLSRTTSPRRTAGILVFSRRGSRAIEAHHAEVARHSRPAPARKAGTQRQMSPSTLTSSSSGTRPATRASRLASVGIGPSPTRQPLSSAWVDRPIRSGLAHSRQASASWKTTIWSSAVSRRSHSIPAPDFQRRGERRCRLFSGKPEPWCSPRCAKPAGPGSSGSGADRRRSHRLRPRPRAAAPERRPRCGHGARPRRTPPASAPIAPLATLGWSVKVAARVDEHAELDDPLDPVERAQRGLHLGQQHDPAAPRRGDPGLQIDVLAEPAL